MKKSQFTLLLFFISIISYAQNYKFGKVSKAALTEKAYPLDSTTNAAYLYKYRKTYFKYSEQGFRLITEVQIRVKIYNKKGFDFATQKITYINPDHGSKESVSSIKAYTYNLVKNKVKKEKVSRKNIFDVKLSKYRSQIKITMPNIKEGSVFELKYRISSPYWEIKDLQFQYGIPVKKLEYHIEIPEYFVFNKKAKGYYFITPKIERKNRSFSWSTSSKLGVGMGQQARTGRSRNKVDYVSVNSIFSAQNIPALKDNEPYVSNVNNYRGGMIYELTSVKFPNSSPKFYANTWNAVGKEIYKESSFGGELSKTSYYKKDLTQLLKEAKSNVQKMLTIYQYVKTKVKWNHYYGKYTDVGVKKAYKEGTGNVADINLMLISMLKSVGLNARPVLVSTRNNGVPIFPTIDGFNYVIAQVKFPNGVVLLDATNPYAFANVLPLRVLNWKGRLVSEDGSSSWVSLIPQNYALEDNTVSVSVDENLTVAGITRTKYTNLEALNYRSQYNHIKDEDIRAKVENQYKIEIDNFKILNKKRLDNPVLQMFKFSSEDLVEEINNKLYINPSLFLAKTTNPFKSEERKFPVDFGAPWETKNTINIQLPKGYVVESLPKSAAYQLNDNVGEYVFKIIASNGKVKMVSDLKINSGIILPSYYKQLKEMYKFLTAKQAEKVVLVKQ